MSEKFTENLRAWRKDRNITNPNTVVYVGNVVEELLEIFYSDKKTIDILKNDIMDLYFDNTPISELNTVDAIKDIQVFSVNEIELMKFDNDKTGEEVFKHINSRVQDPNQYQEWKKHGPHGKWKKYVNQDKNTIYEPDYESCRLED